MNIKKLYIIIFLFSLISCENKKVEWYQNGNLHESKISDWKNSSEENKLATCADFIVNLKKVENIKYESMDLMKIDAFALKTCIDEGCGNNNYADSMKVKEIAVLCHILIKSNE